MCPGNPLGDHGQRAIALAVIFEPVLAYEDGMGVSAPLPHQARAGLQHAAGVERTSAFLELCRQNPKAALQCAAGAAMGALLQLIGEPPDDQIATEAQRWSAVIQRPPGVPQLLCRAIDQPGDFAINLGQVLVVRPVPSGVVCTETEERLASALASRAPRSRLDTKTSVGSAPTVARYLFTARYSTQSFVIQCWRLSMILLRSLRSCGA